MSRMKFLMGYVEAPQGLEVNGTNWTDVAMVVCAVVTALIMLFGLYIKWRGGKGK